MSKQNNNITDVEIKDAYYEHLTLGKMAVALNIPHVSVWRRCQQLGLTFKIGGKNDKYALLDILDGKHPQYQSNKLKIRLIKEDVLENVCSICLIESWNNKPLVLQLDHINGISNDHRLSNLRLLCPNCHSQTDTYCGKNKDGR